MNLIEGRSSCLYQENSVFMAKYDRVGLDAKVRFAEVSFYYNPGGAWSSHGIRVKTRGFIDHTDGSTDNLNYWKDALDRVKQGSEIVVDLAKAYASVKGGKGSSGGKKGK